MFPGCKFTLFICNKLFVINFCNMKKYTSHLLERNVNYLSLNLCSFIITLGVTLGITLDLELELWTQFLNSYFELKMEPDKTQIEIYVYNVLKL